MRKKVGELVKKIEKELNCEVTEAHVKEFNPDSDPMFVYEGGSPGIKVKAEELKQSLVKALEAENLKSELKIPVTETQPKTTVEDVKRSRRLSFLSIPPIPPIRKTALTIWRCPWRRPTAPC
ncbi:MAG: hypothetical protein ACLT1K_12930 [[Clostridium] leptum]